MLTLDRKAGDTCKKVGRNLALDFTKGALVLFMVLYHWINYFVSTQGYFYRYLRFITPSFIFISGFLVTNVYLAKYEVQDGRLHKRLAQRGLKLLALFSFLNIAANLAFSVNYNGRRLGIGSFVDSAYGIYVTGNGAAAFKVLVPISYLLLLAALLLLAGPYYRRCLYALSVLVILCNLALASTGMPIWNLELISVGLLGMVVGMVPSKVIDRIPAYAFQIIGANAVYLILISIWDVTYVTQVIGVCLAVAVIYILGTKTRGTGTVQGGVLVLGKYSLLAYIIQITILQLLRRSLHNFSVDNWVRAVSFVSVFALTQLGVELVDRFRRQSSIADKLYAAVFS